MRQLLISGLVLVSLAGCQVPPDRLPPELPDGTPGHTAAHTLIARMSRLCYDALRV